MKKIILGLFALNSLSAQATILTTVDKNAVLNEVLASLKRHPLTCVNKVNGKTISFAGGNIKSVMGDNFNLTIHLGEQPVIVFQKKFESDQTTQTMKVTTDSLYKTVVGLETEWREAPVVTKTNTGTIINPVYQDVMNEGTLKEQLSCKE